MSYGPDMRGMDAMFTVFPVLFIIVFVMVIGMFILVMVRGIGTWSKNNSSPRLTVPAEVVAKRMDVTHHRHGGMKHTHVSASAWYYATFQVESGDRMELAVSGTEYGLLAEGDRGNLTFQGTRYLAFERS